MRKILPLSVAGIAALALFFAGCSDTYTVNNEFGSVPGPSEVTVTYYPGANMVEWPAVPAATTGYTVFRQLVKEDADNRDDEWPWIPVGAVTNTTPGAVTQNGWIGFSDIADATNTITADRQYRYKVVTSNTATQQTGEKVSEVIKGKKALAAPATLVPVTALTTAIQGNVLKVSWTSTNPVSPAVEYRVTYNTSGNMSTNETTTENSVDLSNIGNGAIIVQAFLHGNQSVASEKTSIQYFQPTVNLQIQANFGAVQHTISAAAGTTPAEYNVRLSWNAVSGATAYKVYRAKVDNTVNNNVISGYEPTAINITGAAAAGTTNVIVASDNPAYRQGYSYQLIATVNGQDVLVNTTNPVVINSGIYIQVEVGDGNVHRNLEGPANNQPRVSVTIPAGTTTLRKGETLTVYRRINQNAGVAQWEEVGTMDYTTYNAGVGQTGGITNNTIPDKAFATGLTDADYIYKALINNAAPVNSAQSLGY